MDIDYRAKRIYELYIGLILFWTIYLGIGIWFPKNKAVTRKIANITNKKVIINLIQNIIVTILMMPIISLIPSFEINISIIKYLLTVIIMESWFYYSHRLLHCDKLYKYHSVHHEFIQPYALAGLYCSYVEMILVNLMTLVLPIQLLNYHLVEICIISILVSLNVLKGHSGIQLYYHQSLFSSQGHDQHHLRLTVNYGLISILDRFHNTYCP